MKKKVELKANLSLIESVSRLDCGGWEKETTCGIRPIAAAGQPCFTSFGLKSDADLSCTSIWSGTSFLLHVTYSETNRTCGYSNYNYNLAGARPLLLSTILRSIHASPVACGILEGLARACKLLRYLCIHWVVWLRITELRTTEEGLE